MCLVLVCHVTGFRCTSICIKLLLCVPVVTIIFIVNEYNLLNLLMAMLHDQTSLIWCLQMIVQYNNFLLLIYKNVGSCHPSFTENIYEIVCS